MDGTFRKHTGHWRCAPIQYLAGKLSGKRPLGRLRHRWEYYIKMNLRYMGYEGLDWTEPTRDMFEK
jgi:hypothetical protein